MKIRFLTRVLLTIEVILKGINFSIQMPEKIQDLREYILLQKGLYLFKLNDSFILSNKTTKNDCVLLNVKYMG